MEGLAGINIELTSRCNKGNGVPGAGCWMCGRRKLEREYPHLCDWGDMPAAMVEQVAEQVPTGVLVQFHNNGEPLLAPTLPYALNLFKDKGCYTAFDTNGKLLYKRRWDVMAGGLDSITISVFEGDPEGNEQYQEVIKFLHVKKEEMDKKGFRRPIVNFRILGDIREDDRLEAWRQLAMLYKCKLVFRVLHSADGSRDYQRPVTIPEHGICLEMLHKLSIDRYGNVSPCVRFNPQGLGVLGNIEKNPLKVIWTGEERQAWVKAHLEGKRHRVPLCSTCDYFGVPIA